MTSSKTRTEPLLARPTAGDTLPDVPLIKTDPLPIVTIPDVEATAQGLDDSTTDPGPPPENAPASESARVDDVLRNMKGPRVWSPPAASRAESEGADFVAYHALGAVAKRHDTPAIGERVVVDITIPSSASPNDELVHRPPEELAALIQESRARGAGPHDARADANAVTEVRGRPRRRGLAIFAVTLAIVVVLGAVAVWGDGERAAVPQVDSGGGAAAGSMAVSRSVVAPAASPAPVFPMDTPAASTVVAATVTPRALPPRPTTSLPAPTRATPESPPVRNAPPIPPPVVSDPKPDLPKNDLPRSL